LLRIDPGPDLPDPIRIDAAPDQCVTDGPGDRDHAVGQVPLPGGGREMDAPRGHDRHPPEPRREDGDLERVRVVGVDDVESAERAGDGHYRPRVRAAAPGDPSHGEPLFREALLERTPRGTEAELPHAVRGEAAHEEPDLVLPAGPDPAGIEVEDGEGGGAHRWASWPWRAPAILSAPSGKRTSPAVTGSPPRERPRPRPPRRRRAAPPLPRESPRPPPPPGPSCSTPRPRAGRRRPSPA